MSNFLLKKLDYESQWQTLHTGVWSIMKQFITTFTFYWLKKLLNIFLINMCFLNHAISYLNVYSFYILLPILEYIVRCAKVRQTHLWAFPAQRFFTKEVKNNGAPLVVLYKAYSIKFSYFFTIRRCFVFVSLSSIAPCI